MPQFSFSEKEWDKIRPMSVKKTGVSEAMRAVLKGVPQELRALRELSDCDKATELLTELEAAFEKGKGMIKPKDDKHDAIATLRTWQREVEESREMITQHRGKLLLARAQAAADARYEQIVTEVENVIREAKETARDLQRQLQAGNNIDLEARSQRQQDMRDLQRTAAKAPTKAGFVDLVRFLDGIHGTGIEVSQLEMPDSARTIRERVGELAECIDQIGEIFTEVVAAQTRIEGENELADLARSLIAQLKESMAELKKLSTRGKALEVQAKKVAEAIKHSQVTDTTRLLALAQKLHEVTQEFEVDFLEEASRSRSSSGDLQTAYREASHREGWEPYNPALRGWRSAIFDIIRTCTLPLAYTKNQLDRAIKALIEVGGTTGAQASMLEQRIQADRQALARKYGTGG